MAESHYYIVYLTKCNNISLHNSPYLLPDFFITSGLKTYLFNQLIDFPLLGSESTLLNITQLSKKHTFKFTVIYECNYHIILVFGSLVNSIYK